MNAITILNIKEVGELLDPFEVVITFKRNKNVYHTFASFSFVDGKWENNHPLPINLSYEDILKQQIS